MTANNAPEPYVASASSEVGDGARAYRAFDDNISSGWATNFEATGWLKIDLGSAHTACAYAITGYYTASGSPKDWTFDGSNNDIDWTTLDTQTDIVFEANQERIYTFTNTVSY